EDEVKRAPLNQTTTAHSPHPAASRLTESVRRKLQRRGVEGGKQQKPPPVGPKKGQRVTVPGGGGKNSYVGQGTPLDNEIFSFGRKGDDDETDVGWPETAGRCGAVRGQRGVHPGGARQGGRAERPEGAGLRPAPDSGEPS